MKTVFIYIEGGVVQDMNIPEGTQVIVHDYDVEGMEIDDPQIHTDEDGNEYFRSTWEPMQKGD